MRIFRCSAARIHLGLRLALGTVSLCHLSGALVAAEADSPKKKDALPAKEPAPPPKKSEKKPRKKLSGAELYALHCNRCHPERYAPERTADQWKTILLHMRTRANVPAEQAKSILQFLQEDSGK